MKTRHTNGGKTFVRSTGSIPKIAIKPTKQLKLKEFRTWLAFRLVDLASFIKPHNEAVVAYLNNFIQECLIEEVLHGNVEIKVKKAK